MSGRGLVGVLMRGRPSDLPVAEAAVDLVGDRPRGLVVFMVRLPVRRWSAAEFGLDPGRLSVEVELDQRRVVAEVLSAAGLRAKHSVTAIDRPILRSGIRAAKREGCEVLVAKEPLLGRVALPGRSEDAGNGGLRLRFVERSWPGWTTPRPELALPAGS